MTKYDDIIARLERATEGSRELDALIAIAIGARPDWLALDTTPLVHVGNGYVRAGKYGPGFNVQLYSTSLDAAFTLVPEGWLIQAIGQYPSSGLWYVILEEDELPSTSAEDKDDAALALCIAALRARQISENEA